VRGTCLKELERELFAHCKAIHENRIIEAVDLLLKQERFAAIKVKVHRGISVTA
jgi:hypothetical protein